MERKYLLKKLHIPLGLITLIFLILGIIIPWRGLFINLSTTFFGILITLLYVDHIIREDEQKQWDTVKERIYSRLEGVANMSTHQFRIAFKISADIISRDANIIFNTKRRRAECIRVNEEILLPEVSKMIPKLDTEKWQFLLKQMEISYTSIDKIVTVFGHKLPPKLLTLLIDLQDKMWGVLSIYRIIPDLYGIPDKQLKRKDIKHIETKRVYESLIIKDVESIMKISSEILRSLN
jgi:hypothetical protein